MKFGIFLSLLSIVAYSQAADTDLEISFKGQFGKYYLLGDDSLKNKFEVKFTLKAEDVKKGDTFSIDVYDDSNPPKKFITGTPKELEAGERTIKVDLKSLANNGKGSMVLTFKLMKANTALGTKKFTLNTLDVQNTPGQYENVEVKKSPDCLVTLEVNFPPTLPALEAKCGIWLEDKTSKGYTDVKGLVFDSTNKNDGWSIADGTNNRKSQNLKKQTLKLISLEDVKDLNKKQKYVKCEMIYKGAGKYLEKYIPIVVENDADTCHANPAVAILVKNPNMKAFDFRSVTSCYDKKPVQTISNYECTLPKDSSKLFTRCDVSKSTYEYSKDGLKYHPFKEADIEKVSEDCFKVPETLVVGDVVFKGPYKKFAIDNNEDQAVSSSFTIAKSDITLDKMTATAKIFQGEKEIFSEKFVIKKTDFKNDTIKKFVIKEQKITIASLTIFYTTVKIGDSSYKEKSGKLLVLPFIEVKPMADVTNVHVDNEKCSIEIKEVSRSATKPALFGFCGIWEAESVEKFTEGKWLARPDSMKPNGLSFSSKRKGEWIEEVKEGFTHLILKNKSIKMSLMPGTYPKWFRCKHWVDDDSQKPIGDFSDIQQRIIAHSAADSCGANPLEEFKAGKYSVDFIVNEESKSCFSEEKVATSITAACKKSDRFYNVDCENGAYVIKNNKKNRGDKYNKETMKGYLKHCSSGAMVTASKLLLSLAAILAFFKSF